MPAKVSRPPINEYGQCRHKSMRVQDVSCCGDCVKALDKFTDELETRAKALADEADRYVSIGLVSIGYDHSHESGELVAALKALRALMEGQ